MGDAVADIEFEHGERALDQCLDAGGTVDVEGRAPWLITQWVVMTSLRAAM